MKIFFDILEVKTKKKDIENHIYHMLINNDIDEDDKGQIEVEVFFGKKFLTIKVFDRTLN